MDRARFPVGQRMLFPSAVLRIGMAFVLSEEQELIRRTVRSLAEGPILEASVEADLRAEFPRGNVERLAELGLLGVLVDAEQGGAGADMVTLALVCEELGAACASTGAFVAMTNAWVTDLLARHAPQQMRDEWLPRILSGESLGTFAVHEDAVGADPFRLRTAFHPNEDSGEEEEDRTGFLSGTKDLVLLSGVADFVVAVARERQPNGDRKVGLWGVPTSRDGMTWGGEDGKLGLRALPTAPLYLVRVPAAMGDRITGSDGAPDAVRRARQVFMVATAATAVGSARAALDGAVAFAKEREQFGSPIARYEAIQHSIANIHTGVESARGTVLHAASLLDREDEAPVAVQTANIQAFEATRVATRTAIRVHGGAGFMRDLPIERYARDVRTLAVLGRSTEVSKSLVGMHQLQVDEHQVNRGP